MKEVIRGGTIYHGSFNADVLSLCNESHQATTVIYGNTYQTEQQEASILDSVDIQTDG